MYKHLIRPALFTLEPERAHSLALRALEIAGHEPLRSILSWATQSPRREQKLFGLTFPNPIGLAAGFAKNAEALPGIQALGFGFVEIGTVVPQPQIGNPTPRLFRLVEDESIINRMGFNSRGAQVARRNLARAKPYMRIPVGASIGKNKDTSLERAADDYVACVHDLHPFPDFYIINVSSPNTPGLRDLQQKEAVAGIVTPVQKALAELALRSNTTIRPLLLKVAPDVTNEGFDDILDVVEELHISGLIVSNTTLARPEQLRSKQRVESGGLSGPLLFERCVSRVARAHTRLPKLPIIASGGINSMARAQTAREAGASLVQILTGMVYEGPLLATRINRGL